MTAKRLYTAWYTSADYARVIPWLRIFNKRNLAYDFVLVSNPPDKRRFLKAQRGTYSGFKVVFVDIKEEPDVRLFD